MTQFIVLLLLGLTAVVVSPARIHKRVVNGDVAAPAQFRYMVSLRDGPSASHVCGGSIVTPEHIVTAAHCVADSEPNPVSPESIFIVTGHVNNIEGGRTTAISEIRLHPEYQPLNMWRNDIAVLKTATPIPYTAVEQPIPIASADTTDVQSCVLSGWGRIHFPTATGPSQLQMILQNTMSAEVCTDIYSSSLIFESTLCAGGSYGNGVCSGDSGGPLACNGELAGVVSWGFPCANGIPDGYARVFYYRDWLLANIADLSPLGRAYAAEALAARKALE